jgi:hypothetical protein
MTDCGARILHSTAADLHMVIRSADILNRRRKEEEYEE